MLKMVFAKLKKKKIGNQGITAAIILIAFVIIASLIAFVILSMGQQFAGQAEQTGANALALTIVQKSGAVIAYDKYSVLIISTDAHATYAEVNANGTGWNFTPSSSTYYAAALKSAFDTVVFEITMPTTATEVLDFAVVRLKLEIASVGTHAAGGGGLFEFTHDTSLDDLAGDGTGSATLTNNTSTGDYFGWKDVSANGDDNDFLDPGETFRITLRMDLYAMANGYSFPHEIYQNDQFSLTVFIGETNLQIPVMTCAPTIQASQSW